LNCDSLRHLAQEVFTGESDADKVCVKVKPIVGDTVNITHCRGSARPFMLFPSLFAFMGSCGRGRLREGR